MPPETSDPGQLVDDTDVRRLREATPHRVTRRISQILSPVWVVTFVWCAACFLVPNVPTISRWLFAVVGLATLVSGPYASLRISVHRRTVSDRQVVRRSERHHLYAAIGAWVITGCVLLAWLRAPISLVGVAAAMLAGLVLVSATNLIIKTSFHVAVITGAVVILWCLCWPLGVALSPAPLALAWARWDEGRHSFGQVLLGAVVGAIGATSYLLFSPSSP